MILVIVALTITAVVTAVFSRSSGSTWAETIYECAVVLVAVSVFCIVSLILIFTESIPA